MAEASTIARPYAQAVFDLAQQADDFDSWSRVLTLLAEIASDVRVQELVKNPKLADSAIAEFLISLASDQADQQARNFIKLLVHNGRVEALPEISSIYADLRSEAEKTIDAELETAMAVDSAQAEALEKALAKRLGRAVNLNFKTNEELIGGAVIRAGDWVIDGSVLAQIKRLTGALGA